MERVRKAIKKTFFAGLVVVVPIVITAVALIWLFRLLDGFLSPIMHQLLGREIAGLGLLTEIVLIFLVGLLATNVFGARLLKFMQDMLMRIPVVKNIYPTIRQIVEAFSPNKESSFRKVVLVEYPQKGTFSLGFLTSEVSMNFPSENHRFYSVYIPTNNLYLGHVLLFKVEEVFFTGITVEEGFKIILSGGTSFPPIIKGQSPKSMP
ncbi:MAG: DUF502 domain-containing protein [Thermodesulfobacteriota bacterium]|nr:DUF502 domain-containing protein [Thermodesulfobacteriota bacterium]